MTLDPETMCECSHPLKVHCKGGVFHSNYKDAMRQAPNPRGEKCVSTHCESVLCCCISFRPAGGEA